MEVQSKFVGRYKKDLSIDYLRAKLARRNSESQKLNRHKEFRKSRGLALADVNVSLSQEPDLATVEEVNESSVTKIPTNKPAPAKPKVEVSEARRAMLQRFKEEQQLRKLKEQREKASKGVFRCGIYKPENIFVPPPQQAAKVKPKEKPAPPPVTRVTRSTAKAEAPSVLSRPSQMANRTIPKGRGQSNALKNEKENKGIPPAVVPPKTSKLTAVVPPKTSKVTAIVPPKTSKVTAAVPPKTTKGAVPSRLPAASKAQVKAPAVSKPLKAVQKKPEQKASVEKPEPAVKDKASTDSLPEQEMKITSKCEEPEETPSLPRERIPSFAPENFEFKPLDGLSTYTFQPMTPNRANAFLTPTYTWSPVGESKFVFSRELETEIKNVSPPILKTPVEQEMDQSEAKECLDVAEPCGMETPCKEINSPVEVETDAPFPDQECIAVGEPCGMETPCEDIIDPSVKTDTAFPDQQCTEDIGFGTVSLEVTPSPVKPEMDTDVFSDSRECKAVAQPCGMETPCEEMVHLPVKVKADTDFPDQRYTEDVGLATVYLEATSSPVKPEMDTNVFSESRECIVVAEPCGMENPCEEMIHLPVKMKTNTFRDQHIGLGTAVSLEVTPSPVNPEMDTDVSSESRECTESEEPFAMETPCEEMIHSPVDVKTDTPFQKCKDDSGLGTAVSLEETSSPVKPDMDTEVSPEYRECIDVAEPCGMEAPCEEMIHSPVDTLPEQVQQSCQDLVPGMVASLEVTPSTVQPEMESDACSESRECTDVAEPCGMETPCEEMIHSPVKVKTDITFPQQQCTEDLGPGMVDSSEVTPPVKPEMDTDVCSESRDLHDAPPLTVVTPTVEGEHSPVIHEAIPMCNAMPINEEVPSPVIHGSLPGGNGSPLVDEVMCSPIKNEKDHHVLYEATENAIEHPVVESLPQTGDQPVNTFIQSEATLHDVPYFRGLLKSNIQKLTLMCTEWDTRIEMDIPDDAKDLIRTTVGQTRLLMVERFKQFEGLVDCCEFKLGEKETTCTDLDGFWDMIFFQIEDVSKKFVNLEKMEANSWQQTTFETKKVVRKRPAPKNNVTKVQGDNGRAAARSRLANIKAALRNKMKQEEVVAEVPEPPMPINPVVFDAGFFRIESPAKLPGSIRTRHSSRCSVTPKSTKKVTDFDSAEPTEKSQNSVKSPVRKSLFSTEEEESDFQDHTSCAEAKTAHEEDVCNFEGTGTIDVFMGSPEKVQETSTPLRLGPPEIVSDEGVKADHPLAFLGSCTPTTANGTSMQTDYFAAMPDLIVFSPMEN